MSAPAFDEMHSLAIFSGSFSALILGSRTFDTLKAPVASCSGKMTKDSFRLDVLKRFLCLQLVVFLHKCYNMSSFFHPFSASSRLSSEMRATCCLPSSPESAAGLGVTCNCFHQVLYFDRLL